MHEQLVELCMYFIWNTDDTDFYDALILIAFNADSIKLIILLQVALDRHKKAKKIAKHHCASLGESRRATNN